MFCNQFSLHSIHTVTTLCCTSFNVPFSGELTKKGDCIALQHLQIVVVYLSANMEARGNAFKTTRQNLVHVAQLCAVAVKLLSITNTGEKNLRGRLQQDNIKQKSSDTACNAALPRPARRSLITLKFCRTEA